MLNKKEITALLSLLDDPDGEVHQHVVDRLSSYGREMVPYLESAWENSFDPIFQQKVEENSSSLLLF